MPQKTIDVLKTSLDDINFQKLAALKNDNINKFVAEYIQLCQPTKIFICSDSPEDLSLIREGAIKYGEESQLAIKGHTVHFDGYYDQARDKEHTKFLLPKNINLGSNINAIDKEAGLKEIRAIMHGIMDGHVMIIRFFCLGPTNSQFSVLSCQITDSYYVAHSLDLLYRQGYEEFKRSDSSVPFFRIVHSQGELDGTVSKNIDKRRIYIDTEDSIVYSANTQYGGNTLGLKKLSMRLAIKRASEEGWLCEHMFIMGIHGPNDRLTYFTGAFPSLCGKTSTSMMQGEKIIGDDIAYIRNIEQEAHGVNVEKGMFGIIMGINSKDDPILYKTLQSPHEIIISNVLVTEDQSIYWIDKDDQIPSKGINHSGEWWPGKKDRVGNEIPPSHKNARFTLDLKCLKNVDRRIDDPNGVEVGGMIYGGRDSQAWVPVRESFDWNHGIITLAAALESETTAATLGQEGVPKFNPMSNLDFVSIPLGRYILNNLEFGLKLKSIPKIFGVNYFLKDNNDSFLNEKTDKAIWLKWMERRVHGEFEAYKTPIGYIPKYQDLKQLFQKIQKKDYTQEAYIRQFSLRVKPFLAKINRIIEIYKTKVPDAPPILFQELENEIERIKDAQKEYGEVIPPGRFE